MGREHVSGDEPTVSSRKLRRMLHDPSRYIELGNGPYTYADAKYYLPEQQLTLEAFANIARSKRKSRALANTVHEAEIAYRMGKRAERTIARNEFTAIEHSDTTLQYAANALIIDLYDYLNTVSDECDTTDS